MALCRRTMQGTMSQTQKYSSVSRREINRGSLSSPRSVKLARYVFSLALHPFFLITGLIATQLVNRVPFVRFAGVSLSLSLSLLFTIVSYLYSIPLFDRHIVSRWFSNCLSPLIPSIIVETPRCTFRYGISTQKSICEMLVFFYSSSFFLSFPSFFIFEAGGLRRCGRFRRHDGRLWCLRWSG